MKAYIIQKEWDVIEGVLLVPDDFSYIQDYKDYLEKAKTQKILRFSKYGEIYKQDEVTALKMHELSMMQRFEFILLYDSNIHHS